MTVRKPTYLWDQTDSTIEDAIIDLTEKLKASGYGDESISYYVADFLDAVHRRWPAKVWIKNPPPQLRVIKGGLK
jgi:hypothetical protein